MNINIVIYASFLFFLSEFILMLFKRSGKKGTKIKKDRRSLLLLWMIITLGLSVGFMAAKYDLWSPINEWLAIAGLLLYLLGVLIRWIAILSLKKEFTVDVSLRDNHQLKKDGIYRHLRHPSYLGLLLICFGLALSMNSLISLAVISIPITLGVLYRIKIEEEILLDEFGTEYQDYMEKSKKLIPSVY